MNTRGDGAAEWESAGGGPLHPNVSPLLTRLTRLDQRSEQTARRPHNKQREKITRILSFALSFSCFLVFLNSFALSPIPHKLNNTLTPSSLKMTIIQQKENTDNQ